MVLLAAQVAVLLDARRTEPVIEVADRLSTRLGRPPTCYELLQEVLDPLIEDRLNHEPSGDRHTRTVTTMSHA